MRRSKPDPERMRAAIEHARQKRIEAGLPPEAPENAVYEQRWQRDKATDGERR